MEMLFKNIKRKKHYPVIGKCPLRKIKPAPIKKVITDKANPIMERIVVILPLHFQVNLP
jgi:hypothetical protein